MRAPVLALLALLVAASCAHRDEPDWAKLPASGTSGDSTVSGAPATVGSFATPPVLDGKLDDPAWRSAAVLGPFVDPGEGGPAGRSLVPAYAKMGWDQSKLYVAVVVRDASAASPFTRDQDDPHLWEKASAVEIMLQPGDHGDNRDYYEIQVGVHGAVFDTHWDDYNVPITGSGESKRFGHMEWSSHAERGAWVSPAGFYGVEIAIPWSALVPGRTPIPPKAGDVWRVNLYSFRDGQRQALAWSPIRHQGNFHKASRFGRIQFR